MFSLFHDIEILDIFEIGNGEMRDVIYKSFFVDALLFAKSCASHIISYVPVVYV